MEASPKIAGKRFVRPLFLPILFSVLVGTLYIVSGGKVTRHLWIGRARHPGPSRSRLAIEGFNVGGWLTHGDLVLEAPVDFIAAVEHWLIPARVRSDEWTRLRAKGHASVWAPAPTRNLLMLVIRVLGLLA